MLRTRSRVLAVAVVAAVVPLVVGGPQAGAAAPRVQQGAGSADSATTAPCLEDATTLIGDVDGDGHPDRIVNPGDSGTEATIQWGGADGSFGEKQSVAALVGARNGEIATAAFADLDNDGALDLVVNLVEPSGGDDPSQARVSEYRPGPLDREDLGSEGARQSDIGSRGEALELRIADYGGDEYPDLAILSYAGDGVIDRDVRLSGPEGLGAFDRDATEKYGDWGTRPEPPEMPTGGWAEFYGSCS